MTNSALGWHILSKCWEKEGWCQRVTLHCDFSTTPHQHYYMTNAAPFIFCYELIAGVMIWSAHLNVSIWFLFDLVEWKYQRGRRAGVQLFMYVLSGILKHELLYKSKQKGLGWEYEKTDDKYKLSSLRGTFQQHTILIWRTETNHLIVNLVVYAFIYCISTDYVCTTLPLSFLLLK
jgi:hypothetical protein